MKSVNKVVLLGHVTHDPEIKTTKNGQHVCTFDLATSREWKDSAGEMQLLAEFHHIVVWGAFATTCGTHVKKGKPLYIEGYLKTNSWEGKQREKVSRTEIVAEEVVFLAASAQAK
jgi:single-strand DNA-binding protein